MALQWEDFNNGDLGGEVRSKINAFNSSVVLNYEDLQELVSNNRAAILLLNQDVNDLSTNKENSLGVPANDGYVLHSNTNGNRYWQPVSGGIVEVNWGDIGGTLSNQTDLQTELNNLNSDIQDLAQDTYNALLNKVNSDPSIPGVGTAVTNIVAMTQTEYDGITPDATTWYIIKGA